MQKGKGRDTCNQKWTEFGKDQNSSFFPLVLFFPLVFRKEGGRRNDDPCTNAIYTLK